MISKQKTENLTKTKKGKPVSSRGFTLIEMIVSVSIFTIVVFVAVGALLAITDANRKANSIRAVMDNISFAMEFMARSMRTGNNYGCEGSGNCTNGGSFVTFTDQSGIDVTYKYDTPSKSIMVKKGSGSFARITAPEVDIQQLVFYVTGVGADSRQPKVTILIKGTAGILDKVKTNFSVQTTVSQRQVES